jgi:VWFA-related protein
VQKFTLLLLLTSLSLPALANKRVTVEQLERLLAANRGKTDEKIAQQLFGLEITERLSSAKLSRWESILPGPESRRSLLILADMSAFLDPPAAEIPATATPDLASQQQMMALAVSYTAKTISTLPNFLATRDTIFFEDTPTVSKADSSVIPYQPLHPVSRSSEAVVYREGREVVDSGNAKHKKQDSMAHGLTTWGVFGPILGTVLVDVGQGKLVWSHWEQAASGPVAVFHFQVTKEKSHYEVSFCCVAGDGNGVFRQYSGYSGEIAVDPVDGTIHRLTLKADLKSPDPLLRSDIMVEYGHVEIGGRTYTCPIKSVSVTIVPTLPLGADEMTRYQGLLLDTDKYAAMEHLQTLLNDVAFANYHLFRAESRILTGDNASTDHHLSAPLAAPTSASAAPTSTANQSEDITPQTAVASSSADSTASESTAPIAPDTPLSEGTRPEPTSTSPIPEISIAEPANPSADTAVPMLLPGAGFTMRVTSRLVDVGVVAFDKKGHPITDLSSDNFEIYDNGHKQTVRIFSRAGDLAPQEFSAEQQKPGTENEELVYSNRQPNIVDSKPRAGAREGSVTILLIDSSSLTWSDLNYARDEMLKFLQKLASTERVGLYDRSSSRFNVLVEPTADHAMLASKLHRWMPTARDLAQAREAEQRNRQQIHEVLHQDDLQYVNGNVDTPAETVTMVDPQLREYGSNPGRVALSVLVGVARHLAAIPGHKNLIWVASDNVLADWQDHAVSTDKGSKQVEGFVLRAQEALNDSQISVYPLDASQLETMATDSSLANSSVQLSPSVTVPPGETPQSGVAAPGLGRTVAEMQQDIHPIQGAIQQLAESTGGRVFRRSGNIAANLNTVVEDGRAVYLLGFAPDTQADDKYHLLRVKLSGRRGATLRYRTGFLYTREPATLKERFQQAVWQPRDMSEIAINARFVPTSKGTTLKLNIATNDLALKQRGEHWMDKLDIFLARRDEEGRHASITEQTLRLMLKSSTYARLFQEGVPFDQFIEDPRHLESVRIIVIDENSGSMGSITVPSSALRASQ